MNENTSVLTGFCFFVLMAFCAVMYGCHQSEATFQEAIKAGLVQKRDPGVINPIWVKP